jgi:GNAT superfamily N-acetyltransferase
MTHEWRRGEYLVSTDPARLDVEAIHSFLSEESYWARGRTLETVRRSVENSLPFGLYRGESRQVGFARLITDRATFAWLADVYVLGEERGRGLGKWLAECVVSHPELVGLRRWVLATKDAHGLYRPLGFTELLRPERWMEMHDPRTVERPDYWSGDAGHDRRKGDSTDG